MKLESFKSIVLLDVIYGEEKSTISKVEAAELLRLADYLQISVHITTELFRNIINIEICLALYELSVFYNCASLQKILEAYICNHLEELVNSSYWEASEGAMSSLQKNPLYLSQPVQFIGASSKGMCNRFDFEYKLIAYYKTLYPLTKSKIGSVKYFPEMTVHT